jgi:uncharacterized membrane protein
MTHAGLVFDHLRPEERLTPAFLARDHALFIFSDYPRARVSPAVERALLERVAGGVGLLMIGGWESFHGAAGEYVGSALAEALPVVLRTADDRINCPQPCLLEQVADHPVLEGLPWDQPPGIGGFNHVRVRRGGRMLLAARVFQACRRDGDYLFRPGRAYPLLVVGAHGRGRTAAFTTDVAPHWVGGLVDWGPERVSAAARRGSAVEVGSYYARLLTNLLRWLSSPPSVP